MRVWVSKRDPPRACLFVSRGCVRLFVCRYRMGVGLLSNSGNWFSGGDADGSRRRWWRCLDSTLVSSEMLLPPEVGGFRRSPAARTLRSEGCVVLSAPILLPRRRFHPRNGASSSIGRLCSGVWRCSRKGWPNSIAQWRRCVCEQRCLGWVSGLGWWLNRISAPDTECVDCFLRNSIAGRACGRSGEILIAWEETSCKMRET